LVLPVPAEAATQAEAPGAAARLCAVCASIIYFDSAVRRKKLQKSPAQARRTLETAFQVIDSTESNVNSAKPPSSGIFSADNSPCSGITAECKGAWGVQELEAE